TVTGPDELRLTLPSKRSMPITGQISSDQLRHPLSKKGARMLDHATSLARAGNHAEAIAELRRGGGGGPRPPPGGARHGGGGVGHGAARGGVAGAGTRHRASAARRRESFEFRLRSVSGTPMREGRARDPASS